MKRWKFKHICNNLIHRKFLTGGKLCDHDLQNLKNWTDQWTDKICNELTPQGMNDMKGIASRLKKRLGHRFDFFTTNFDVKMKT